MARHPLWTPSGSANFAPRRGSDPVIESLRGSVVQFMAESRREPQFPFFFELGAVCLPPLVVAENNSLGVVFGQRRLQFFGNLAPCIPIDRSFRIGNGPQRLLLGLGRKVNELHCGLPIPRDLGYSPT